ncbi:O-antigen ligase family protein [Legionella waltersii]|uniref:O-antigen biosynthesis protein n=1 Tax=Legionella waltersii TaxID=66969 RepID=A0A0W1AN94_9GAMM|nr:O-antigen ligase family protein [Legionella waltersii]KTD82809.1 O-antigen biosynthesis protein [Legionella waltersii]SNV01484.1 O-antigen biosynthesis protein [Legionella waltersii]
MQLSLSSAKGLLLAPVFFVLFTFFIPISPTIKSICFVCSLIAILIVPEYRNLIKEAFGTLWGRAAAILFVYIVIATLWSPAPYLDQLGVVGKYCKLIYLPLLAVGFMSPKVRNWSINAYLAAIFLTCIISMLKALNLIESQDPGMVFYNHIITGFMVALAAYLAGLQMFKNSGWLRSIYLFLLVFTSYQVLFINTGRTGYLVYIVLMVLLLVQTLSIKKAVLGLLVFTGTMSLVYQFSPVMQIRTFELLKDIQQLQHNNKNTSLGYRIQFHHYAKQLMMKNPWIGIGTGGFKYSFAKDDPVPSWGKELTDPHSQYWMILAEQGIIGLFLFIMFLASLFVTAFRVSESRPILLGVLIAFCIGSISDTILCYSTAGYLLIVLSALCFGELIANKRTSEETKIQNANSTHLNHSGGEAAF